MTCPNCPSQMLDVAHRTADLPIYHCPACGTLRRVEDGTVHVIVPTLTRTQTRPAGKVAGGECPAHVFDMGT